MRSDRQAIFLYKVAKIKQMMLPDAKDGPVRPVIRTFYDHIQVSPSHHIHGTLMCCADSFFLPEIFFILKFLP